MKNEGGIGGDTLRFLKFPMIIGILFLFGNPSHMVASSSIDITAFEPHTLAF